MQVKQEVSEIRNKMCGQKILSEVCSEAKYFQFVCATKLADKKLGGRFFNVSQ